MNKKRGNKKLIALISIIAMIYYNPLLGGIYLAILAVSLVAFSLFDKKNQN
jgi:ABC-type bacteriocin/lantibiotic exporter with double-glycine peptidase domain